MTDLVKSIKQHYVVWTEQNYRDKCDDIGNIIAVCIFVGIILYAVYDDYLDWTTSILNDELTIESDNLTDEEKTRWLFVLLGYIGGTLLLPVILLHYGSRWIGFGTMYLVWKIRYSKLEGESED